MLYLATKTFDISPGVTAHAGKDIVDVSTWHPQRVQVMIDNHFIIPTDKKVATITEKAETKAPAEDNRPRAPRRVSPLARRQRVFKARLAKQGDK